MSKLATTIRDWSVLIIESGDWQNSMDYMVKLGKIKTGWRPAVVAIVALTKQAQDEKQATEVSKLIAEWLPADMPTKAVAMLHGYEKRMYHRLRSPWGVERSLLREISLSPHGREYLASLRSPLKGTK